MSALDEMEEQWAAALVLPPAVEERPFVLRYEFTQAVAFLRALHPLCEWWHDERARWIFRGHADAAWPLLPSAHRASAMRAFGRRLAVDLPNVDEFSRVAHEVALLAAFYRAADQQGLPVHVRQLSTEDWSNFREMGRPASAAWWPPVDMVPLMALAQHHGVPTRLLDWSWSPFAAAYFAAQEPSPAGAPSLAVWALSSALITGAVATSRGFGCRVVSAPRWTNPNLHAQAGVFTCVRNATDELNPLDVTASQIAEVLAKRGELGRPFVRKLVLPRTEANRLALGLRRQGVSALTLFPGFQGVVEDLLAHARLSADWGLVDD